MIGTTTGRRLLAVFALALLVSVGTTGHAGAERVSTGGDSAQRACRSLQDQYLALIREYRTASEARRKAIMAELGNLAGDWDAAGCGSAWGKIYQTRLVPTAPTLPEVRPIGGIEVVDVPMPTPATVGEAVGPAGPAGPSVFLAGSAAAIADDAVPAESLVTVVSEPVAEPVNDTEAVEWPVAVRTAVEPTNAGAAPAEVVAVAQTKIPLDKAAFKTGCEQGGGSYVENPDGSFQCNLRGGGTIKCPNTTSQCTFIPAPFQQPSDHRNPVGEIGDVGVVAPSDPVVPIGEPVSHPIGEPILEPVVDPIAEPVANPVIEPVVEPLADSVVEEPVVEPILQAVAEPDAGLVAEQP